MEGYADLFQNNLYSVFSSSVQLKQRQLPNSWLSFETLLRGSFGFCVYKIVVERHFIMLIWN